MILAGGQEAAGGRALWIALGFLWLALSMGLPIAIVAAISLGTAGDGQPPFELGLSTANYALLLGDSLYVDAFLTSVRIAATATLICLLIAYPLAWAILRSPPRWRGILLVLVVLPFWTSFLIRIYAWLGLLRPTGLINSVLMQVGVIDAPLPLDANELAIHLGIVYAYLPFMILPLYVALEHIDRALPDAAADLGCRPLRAFLTVIVPLSLPGAVAGCLLVFLPAAGEFVIPNLMGGPDTVMIGTVLWTEFFGNRDWPVAAAIAVVAGVVLILPLQLLRGRGGVR